MEAAPADLDEGPDEVPDHVPEEAVGLQFDRKTVAAAGHLEPAQSADRVLCPAPGGAEGGEVSLAGEERGGAAHAREVQAAGNVPVAGVVERRSVRTEEKKVTVGLGEGAELGVKGKVDFPGFKNGDARRRQAVEGAGERVGRDSRARVKVGHLAESVDAGIGSSRCLENKLFTGDALEGHLQHFLDGGALRLDLPAVERQAVVFEEKAYVPPPRLR